MKEREWEKERARTNRNNNVRWVGYFSSDRSCIICGISTYLYVMTVCSIAHTQAVWGWLAGWWGWCIVVQCDWWMFFSLSLLCRRSLSHSRSASTICDSSNSDSIFGMRSLMKRCWYTIQYMQRKRQIARAREPVAIHMCVFIFCIE